MWFDIYYGVRMVYFMVVSVLGFMVVNRDIGKFFELL